MVRVFSFCLYGPENPRYYPGMLENVELARRYFPDWKVYVYYAPDVTESMVARLSACPTVVLIPTGVTGPINMIRRFYAIDEPGVDLMMVRDADSRIHWKDRWAIRECVDSSCVAHTIRDHEEHTAHMMGGLWGLKAGSGVSLRSEYAAYVEDATRGGRVGHDQNFLADVVYPRVVSRLLVHIGKGPIFLGETQVVKFPFEWTPDVYCGRIEDAFIDRPEPRSRGLDFLPLVYVRVPAPLGPTPPPSTLIGPETSLVPRPPLTDPLHFLKKK